MSSYPEVARPRDQRLARLVQDTFENVGPGQPINIYDLMNETGLDKQDVNTGLHYYRNSLTDLRATHSGGEYAIVQEGGWYWLTNDEAEIKKYADSMFRNARTRSVTTLQQVRVIVAEAPGTARARRAREVLKNGERFVDDLGDLIDDLNVNGSTP